MIAELQKLRESIDCIDREILEIIIKRMECVERVGVIKGSNNFRIYVPERENSIFRNLCKEALQKYGEEKITRSEIENIFTEIISFCRSKERKVRVVIEDYNCFFIAKKIFGSCIDILSSEEVGSEENFDFKIKKFNEISYTDIFEDKIFKFIVSDVDFSGERYIILGKDMNGEGQDSYSGVMILNLQEKKYEFREFEGFIKIREIQDEIEKIIHNPDFKIKIMGSYEKRYI
ncbi:MAG: chorismate mutase [Fusobacteriaceae bacterium]